MPFAPLALVLEPSPAVRKAAIGSLLLCSGRQSAPLSLQFFVWEQVRLQDQVQLEDGGHVVTGSSYLQPCIKGLVTS